MSDVTITVQGEHETWFEAERATLDLAIAFDGGDREEVLRRASDAAARVSARLEPLHASGAVTRWSSDRVHVSAQRPWNNEGRQLPLVHAANVAVQARFRDRDALAAVVNDLADLDGVQITGITWDLSGETRRAALAEAQTAAVRAAVAKGEIYARAAGLSAVAPLAIADPGMLADGGATGGGGVFPGAAAPKMMRAAADSAGGAAGFDLVPERIRIVAQVDVRLSAS
ncbi:SIMPL domain-containing protein [Schumannella luteola]|uniref:DUF541 domain-containing protein n=1 Tax=Schumannella luteola TaxID=472059 RepID=A0A852YI64_9MICO|nr:SIMPL domain-containing protein [Schumannella luteola]NYG99597.1 hypothetical protein [Schumannella luteola]TPX02000.1 SIMPL domain-containing protein [Schumannella luteola]